MKERIFTDKNGEQLIVRHRRSAVFFERKADIENTQMYQPYISWKGPGPAVRGVAVPHFVHDELKRVYSFTKEEFMALYEHLKTIATEAWANFEPKEADSAGADYDSYWDRDHEDEGTLSFWKAYGIHVHGPFQKASENGIARLYKFNKRKFESFIYNFQKVLENM